MAIEAVPEDPDLKRQTLSRIEALGPGLLASNTSALSIDELAADLERPAAFLGLHLFNPVPAMRLVEVVLGSATADATKERAVRLVAALDKEPVVVRDAPGFATSRLGVALGLEAIRMVETGIASVEDIDRAMMLGYRHPVGPLKLGDIVGLDVRLAIAFNLRDAYGARFEPPRCWSGWWPKEGWVKRPDRAYTIGATSADSHAAARSRANVSGRLFVSRVTPT